jgi:iron complex transport system substrate-binding protein
VDCPEYHWVAYATWEGGQLRLEPGDRLRSCPSKRPFQGGVRATRGRSAFTRHLPEGGETGFLLVYCTDGALRGAARPCSSRRLLAAALCAALALGCTRPADTDADAVGVSVVDDAGRTVTLAAPATRVISMVPAQTEIVGILAGRQALATRTRWDTDPALAHLPTVDNALAPSVEWLAAQRPDLVIAWPDAQSRDVVQRLTDIGIPVYASRVESLADIREMIRRLGILLGTEMRADSLVRNIDAELEAVRRATASQPTRTVLYLLNADPATAAGPGTFIDDLITIAGGRNIFHDARQLWPQVSLEEIVRRQPDVIIRPSERALSDPLIGIRDRAGWRDLNAVSSGAVHAVDPDLFNRAGATAGEVARRLARLLHGDAVQP